MDVSATWCGPCWSYHQSGALEDLYVNHGPAGFPGVSANTTDDVMVLWFEGDGSTTQADLECTGGNTQGNWLAGTAFPIIDDASQNGPYAIAFFPTIYTICPNRSVTVSGQASATQHYAGIGNCPQQAEGTDAGLVGYNGDVGLCGAADVPVTVDVQNMGTDDLTSAEIMVYDGATLLSTTNWTGNLVTWASETVDCGTVSVTDATTLDIVINASNDSETSNNTIQKVVGLAPLSSLDITVNIFTDFYAVETSWAIKNAAGTTVNSQSSELEGVMVGAGIQTNEIGNGLFGRFEVTFTEIDDVQATTTSHSGTAVKKSADGELLTVTFDSPKSPTATVVIEAPLETISKPNSPVELEASPYCIPSP
jgi:hypothetical protein